MASSSERSDALDLLQSQNGEGPCFECFRRGTPVSSADLNRDSARWPAFAPAALDRGFASVQALPMRVRGNAIGALNLFRAQQGTIRERDLPLAHAAAFHKIELFLNEALFKFEVKVGETKEVKP